MKQDEKVQVDAIPARSVFELEWGGRGFGWFGLEDLGDVLGLDGDALHGARQCDGVNSDLFTIRTTFTLISHSQPGDPLFS